LRIFKWDAALAEIDRMEFVHRCHFCDWQRESHSPTILQPNCGNCGCLLASGRPEDFAPEYAVELRFARAMDVPPRMALALRVGAYVSVLFTAAITGLHAGGPWIAVSAVGAAGLAVTPALVRD
jgi:hypothetical protein